MRVTTRRVVYGGGALALLLAGAFALGVDAGYENRLKAGRIAEFFSGIETSKYAPDVLSSRAPAVGEKAAGEGSATATANTKREGEGAGNEKSTSPLQAGVDVRTPNVDFTPFLEAWYLIDEKYVFEGKPTEQEKLWGAISGLVRSVGDPYTVFLPPQEAEIFKGDIRGDFGGVGIEIGMRDNVLTVISPLKGTPAEAAGIRAGDKIIEVDGEPTADMSIEEAVTRIRGDVGSEVFLTIFRPSKDLGGGETQEVPVTRDVIEIPTLETRVVGDVYIIELANFAGNAGPLFEKALRDFRGRGFIKLVIDVRNNPGGFLDAAIDMASFFLPKGKAVLIEDRGNENELIHRSRAFEFFSTKPEVVFLVNNGSASASEIFAAALRDNGFATIVGEQTFGKGSVQELVSLTEDTFVKITIAKWLTPGRDVISEIGVEPDVIVEMTAEDAEAGRDPQLDKALEILR